MNKKYLLAPFLAVFAVSLLSFGFYQILRLEFLIWNFSSFSHVEWREILRAFWVGLRFDAVSVAWFSLLPILLSLVPWPWVSGRVQLRVLIVLTLFLQFPAILLGAIDTEYIHFVGRRWTFDSLFMMGELQGKVWAFFFTHWHLILANAILFALFWRLGLKFLNVRSLQKFESQSEKWAARPLLYGALAFVILVWAVVLLRGGLQNKPISFAHAHVFNSTDLNHLVMNTGFSLLKSSEGSSLKPIEYFSAGEDWIQYLNGKQGTPSTAPSFGQKPNVVILLMESFALEYLGQFNGDQPSYTPFLDELAKKSVFLPNAFANGRRSIEGVASIMTGIPALMTQPLIASVYQNNRYEGLGTKLKRAGYHTSFFHGANRGSMFFDEFMPRVGVDHYFGGPEFPNQADHDGSWGIFDEPMMLWMADQMTEFPQPFFSLFFSLTSHHPFIVPKQYEGRFPKGAIEILPTIAYADEALRLFFAKAQGMPWYENTIFIITADHTSKGFRPQYQNELSAYRVPMIIYSPRIQWPQVDLKQIYQHIDLMPTVLDLAKVPAEPQVFFGRSIFSNGERAGVFFTGTSYLFAASDMTANWSLGEAIHFFEPDEHFFQKVPLANNPEKTKREKQFRAQIQYFNNGLLLNKLTDLESLQRRK